MTDEPKRTDAPTSPDAPTATDVAPRKPMRFTVVTILPELITPAFAAGVVGRAVEAGTIVVDTVTPRDFTHDRHKTVDDSPYGGGPGMVMKSEPLLAAIAKASEPLARTGASTSVSTSSVASASATARAPSFGRRVLKTVESTLAKLEAKLSVAAADDDGSRSGTSAESAAADAEAAIAEIEAQLRGASGPASEPPRRQGRQDRTQSGEKGPEPEHGLGATAGSNAASPASSAGSPSSSSAAKPGAAKRSSDDIAAEAALAELEMELGMRAPPADLEIGSRRAEAKILGPADEGQTQLAQLERPSSSQVDEVASDPSSSQVDEVASDPSSSSSSLGPADAADEGQTQLAQLERPSSSQVDEVASAPSSRPSSQVAVVASDPSQVHRILMSPSGTPLTQARVRELAKLDHLVLVCGRYEGIDQRVIDTAIDEEISIGDYVLSGGELAALVVIDAVARLVPGVLGEATSVDDESFSAGMLEYPHYTKPAMHDGRPVPPVLQSGNHAAIAAWRRQQSIERTARRRPDLFRQFRMTKADRKLYAPLRERTHIALVHHPVVDRVGTVITTAITNFDIHDLARSSMTYGLAGYHIVTPVTSQREKAANIATLWIGDEKGEHRAQALRLVRTADTIETVIAELTADYGRPPQVVATSAKPTSFPALPRRTGPELVAEATLDPAPLLILLGTGWGLAETLIPSVSRVLAPIEGDSDWNHLSVRSAAAIILDRLFGRPA